MKLRCQFGFHNWDKWSEPYPDNWHVCQQTRCLYCNKAKITNKWHFTHAPIKMESK